MKIFSLSKIEKLKLIGQCIRAATGIVGASLVLTEGYPYLTLGILASGAIANEVVSFIKEKENEQSKDALENTVLNEHTNEHTNGDEIPLNHD